ncbi:MAG TPA: polysaccharide biosynthesis C-terminal domain-containing protein [Fibrobacteria bacterium]|nr:polysaccharide biosynthesis C-terminal domain-containing protein [Fibrobacteria bacterium]
MQSSRNIPAVPVPENPGIAEDPADEHAHGHGFINQGSRFMLLDNLSRAVEPLLVLTCARLYAGGEWGFFKYYESLLLLMARISALGMQRGVVWIHAQRSDDAAFTRAFSRALNLVVLIATGLALLAGAQWAGWLPSWSSFARGAPGSGALNVACLLAALPLQAGSLLFVQTLINKRRLLSILLVRNIAMPAFTLAPAAILSFTSFREHGVAVPYLAGSAFSFVMGATMYARAYRVRWRDWSKSARVPRDLLRYSLPLGSTDVFLTFAYRVDVILLGRFAGLQAVEVYSVVMMIANTLRSIRQSFDGILLSVFSRARSAVPTAGQIRHFNYAAWIVMTLQVPFLPAVLLFGGDFLRLVGPTYAAGAAALSVAVFFNAWMTLGAFSEPFVAGMGRTRVVPMAQAVFFCGSVLLNLLLIPRLGIPGAALASGLAYMLGSSVNFGAIWRFNGGSFLLPEYWKPFFMGLLMLAPAAAAGLWSEASGAHLSAIARAAILLACLVPFSLHAWRGWKRFNLAR